MSNHEEAFENAITVKKRPKKPSALSAASTFAWRALLRIRYVPEQLFDVTVFPIIFLLMFTYLFGGAISGSTGEYLDFVLPGILVMTVAMITMYTGLDLNKDIEKGVFDRFRSLPIWRPAVLVGALSVDAVRYLIASTIMITLGYILGFRPEAGFGGVVLGVALLLFFSFSLSWIWTMLGIIVRTEKALMAMSMMILFPLTFLSSVFVDPTTMPNWLQKFVDINPITFVVDAVRGLIHGTDAIGDIMMVIYISIGLILVFGTLTMYFFKNKE
ncbi:ABC transporter permease [Aquibacillus koreensis]|uniref:Transport permease protein n=1 Tax=Aquibacillus koreensis TaxID=279446 RepID=A0A9X3WLH3_9BACI|nr:ABC transporter permease [Aquibacillus koreensis]MCT2536432.1 ABC transporter permease [Aquibacillus koreensis]MDC3419479.1 ABC transporter permease [Aquibacillus koreensis]